MTAYPIAMHRSLCPAFGCHAFMTGYEGNDAAEKHGFDEAVDNIGYVGEHFNGVHIRKMCQAGTENGDGIPAGCADDIAIKSQQRHHSDAGCKPGNYQISDGVDGHAPQGIDLLRHLHRSQFRCHGCTYAAGYDDPGQDRPQFTAHGHGHNASQCRLGPITQQDIDNLQGHDHAGKEQGQADDRQGINAEMSHLGKGQAALYLWQLTQGLAKEDGNDADLFKDTERKAADAFQNFLHERPSFL